MRRIPLAALFVAIGLVMTGCGGSGTANSSSATPSANTQDQLVAYARCMRTHGIQVEDPDPAHPGQLHAPKAVLADRTKLDAAEQACRQYGGKLQVDQDNADASDRAVRFARCLRRHGIQVADPQSGQNITLPRGVPSQQAQQAIQDCRRAGSSATPGAAG